MDLRFLIVEQNIINVQLFNGYNYEIKNDSVSRKFISIITSILIS
jgi:hypothetical protein